MQKGTNGLDLNFLSISKDALHWIISFLEKKDLNTLILTSKWFYNSLHQHIPEIWKDLGFFGEKEESMFKILSLRRYSQLKSLCIRLMKVDLNRLLKFEFSRNHLKILVLEDVELINKEILVIEGLKSMTNISYLILHNRSIENEEAEKIKPTLKENIYLKHLRVSYHWSCMPGKEKDAILFTSALKANPNLAHSDFYNNKIKPKRTTKNPIIVSWTTDVNVVKDRGELSLVGGLDEDFTIDKWAFYKHNIEDMIKDIIKSKCKPK